MLKVSGVSQNFGQKILFENVNVTFSPGKRYGLTGPNGAGKSTFMKFLSGEAEPQKGFVQRPAKTSILKQDHSLFDTSRVLDTVIMGNKRLWDAMQEKDDIYARTGAGEEFTDELGMRLGELEGIVAEEDGYSAESDAATLLSGLGIQEAAHELKMSELSAGYKPRVLLAQALFGRPECLLLDEPTNALDLTSVHWLEEFLKRYEGILVVISHDRHFMNEVATDIADIDYESIIVYPGNYDDMVIAKTQLRAQTEQANAERAKKAAQLKEFIARFSAGTRASQVQSRKKELDKLQAADLKRSNIARPFIKFEINAKPSGKNVLTVEGLTKTFRTEGKEDIHICTDLNINIYRGEKVAIVGPSGIGKTTLVRLLLNEIQADKGKISWGHETRVGYFAQELKQGIPINTPIWEWLHTFDEKASREEIRGILGRMLFTGEEGDKLTHVLSGGETARLLFSKLMLQKNNVLIFDEPTNHLDLESISALGDALVKFEGTVLFVTHDRDLISRAATKIISMEKRGIDVFDGTWDEYAASSGFDRK